MFRFAYSDAMLIPYRDIIQPNYNDNQLYCGGKGVSNTYIKKLLLSCINFETNQ